MKKIALILFSLALMVAAKSCKKDTKNTENFSEVTKSRILGRWNFESGSIITTNPPNPEKTEKLNGRPGMYFEFLASGISFNNLEGDAEEPYAVISSSSIRIGEYVYVIKELTTSRFVLESVQSNTTASIRFTMIFTR